MEEGTEPVIVANVPRIDLALVVVLLTCAQVADASSV